MSLFLKHSWSPLREVTTALSKTTTTTKSTICRCASVRTPFFLHDVPARTYIQPATQNNNLVSRNNQFGTRLRVLPCISSHSNRWLSTQQDNSTQDNNTQDNNTQDGSTATSKQTSKWLTVPNVLTVSRIAISPYLGYLVCTENFTWALGLFILAGGLGTQS